MEKRNRRPLDTAFKQQKLKAWQPILTPKWVIATFAVLGLIFIPLGIVLVTISNSVVEVVKRYDNICGPPPNDCTVTMTIDRDMKAPIFFYYQLTNFFQNHRRYVKSRSDAQLRGLADLSVSDYSDCEPMVTSSAAGVEGIRLYPCGLIANSFFNDAFNATVIDETSGRTFLAGDNWLKEGIAWRTDVNGKFQKPANAYEDVTDITTRPGQTGTLTLPSVDDEEFIVWMRTAGLPTFKKLNRIISLHDINAGSTVEVRIVNQFPVEGFNGEKAVVLSTTSILGGKNPFLGYAYISVGVICVVLAGIFVIKHIISPRTLGDMTYFSWNRDRTYEGLRVENKQAETRRVSPLASAGAATTHG